MNRYELIALLIVIVMFAVCILFARWYFGAVMASDFPDWVKYLLLRG